MSEPKVIVFISDSSYLHWLEILRNAFIGSGYVVSHFHTEEDFNGSQLYGKASLVIVPCCLHCVNGYRGNGTALVEKLAKDGQRAVLLSFYNEAPCVSTEVLTINAALYTREKNKLVRLVVKGT